MIYHGIDKVPLNMTCKWTNISNIIYILLNKCMLYALVITPSVQSDAVINVIKLGVKCHQ